MMAENFFSQSAARDADLRADVAASYADVAARGQSKVSACGDLQRLARRFLKWDRTADKADRRDLQRYAAMPLTVANCSWPVEESFREAFSRTIISSANGDKNSEQSNPVRAAFWAAISPGAQQPLIDQALALADRSAPEKEEA
jgi:hypothetical protein